VSALQKCEEDDDTDSSLSTEGTSHFQKSVEMLEECNPKIVLALKSRKLKDLDLKNVLLLDNQSTFDLCCNKIFSSKVFLASKFSGNDKQWWWFTDPRDVQDTRLQIQSMVQQEGNNQHYLSQESHQVLQGDLQ
jgi:hypothetical protein